MQFSQPTWYICIKIGSHVMISVVNLAQVNKIHLMPCHNANALGSIAYCYGSPQPQNSYTTFKIAQAQLDVAPVRTLYTRELSRRICEYQLELHIRTLWHPSTPALARRFDTRCCASTGLLAQCVVQSVAASHCRTRCLYYAFDVRCNVIRSSGLSFEERQ